MRFVKLGIAILAAVVGCGDAIADPIRGAQTRLDAGDDGGRGSAPDAEVPATEHCADAADWPERFAALERELFAAVDAQRAAGIRCGDTDDAEGEREPRRRAPLVRVPELRCSARLHSRDMFERDYVGRENRDGDDFRDRIRATGLAFADVDESIERSDAPAERVLELLLDDSDDCWNLVNSRLDGVGIGHYEGLWTLDFAELEAR